MLTPRFRTTETGTENGLARTLSRPLERATTAQAARDSPSASAAATSKSYFNSPTLLLRPHTANHEFQRKISPIRRGVSSGDLGGTNNGGATSPTSEQRAQDYEQFMQMRFHSFLAKRHAAGAKKPVQLLEIQPESELKVPPRDAMTALVALHTVAVRLAAHPTDRPSEELLEQTLDCLEEYLDGQDNLTSSNSDPHHKVLEYLRRCLYSNQPTSAVSSSSSSLSTAAAAAGAGGSEAGGGAGGSTGAVTEISFVPFFQVVETQAKALHDVKGKYDTRTRKNKELTARIAELELERDELRNKLADQQCVSRYCYSFCCCRCRCSCCCYFFYCFFSCCCCCCCSCCCSCFCCCCCCSWCAFLMRALSQFFFSVGVFSLQ
jgi:hypothetical protein